MLGLVIWWGTPQILSFSPSDEAPNVSSWVNLTITFSRSMRKETVIERLIIKPYNAGEFTWQGNTLVFTPYQPWSANTIVEVQLKAGSRASSIFSLPIRKSISWAFIIGKPRLAYLYPADEPSEIYLLDSSTGESKSIARAPEGIQDYVVNYNGRVIYYSAQDAQKGSSIYRLELNEPIIEAAVSETISPTMVAMSSQILACPQASCRALAISNDEKFLAYELTTFPGADGAGFPQVWIAPLTKSTEEDLSVSARQPHVAGEASHETIMPSWSSDGILVFYDVVIKAFIFADPIKGELSRFTNQTGQYGAWHPNGRDFVVPEIIFPDLNVSESTTQQKPLPDSHLMLINWQAGTIQDLTLFEGIEDAVPAFSPNGNYLAFARKYLDVTRWSPGRQIWLMQTDTKDSKPITADSLFNHFDFAWSPDNELLAFVRFDQSSMIQPSEIWVIEISSGQATRLVRGGYSPQWVP